MSNAYYQRVWDVVNSRWCYYTKYLIDPTPSMGETAPPNSGTIISHNIVSVVTKDMVEEIAITNGVTLSSGDAVSLVSGRVQRSDARAGSIVAGYLGQCISGGTGNAGGTIKAVVALAGVVPATGLTAGLLVYLSTTAIGAVTTTTPSGLGALSQVVGRALSSTAFAMQMDAASVIDWCSPLDIPTNGIFYGRASSANVLASGRITTNGVSCLFGTGRVATVDGAGSAPLFLSNGGPGGDAWLFARASRNDRMRIAHDAGMSGLAWSVWILAFVAPISTYVTLVSKSNINVPEPFDFETAGAADYSGFAADGLDNSPLVTTTNNEWRTDSAARAGTAGVVTAYSREQRMYESLGAGWAAGTKDIMIGNRDDLTTGLTGRIAAFAIWNRAISNAEQVGLAKWARREWAI